MKKLIRGLLLSSVLLAIGVGCVYGISLFKKKKPKCPPGAVPTKVASFGEAIKLHGFMNCNPTYQTVANVNKIQGFIGADPDIGKLIGTSDAMVKKNWTRGIGKTGVKKKLDRNIKAVAAESKKKVIPRVPLTTKETLTYLMGMGKTYRRDKANIQKILAYLSRGKLSKEGAAAKQAIINLAPNNLMAMKNWRYSKLVRKKSISTYFKIILNEAGNPLATIKAPINLAKVKSFVMNMHNREYKRNRANVKTLLEAIKQLKAPLPPGVIEPVDLTEEILEIEYDAGLRNPKTGQSIDPRTGLPVGAKAGQTIQPVPDPVAKKWVIKGLKGVVATGIYKQVVRVVKAKMTGKMSISLPVLKKRMVGLLKGAPKALKQTALEFIETLPFDFMKSLLTQKPIKTGPGAPRYLTVDDIVPVPGKGIGLNQTLQISFAIEKTIRVYREIGPPGSKKTSCVVFDLPFGFELLIKGKKGGGITGFIRVRPMGGDLLKGSFQALTGVQKNALVNIFAKLFNAASTKLINKVFKEMGGIFEEMIELKPEMAFTLCYLFTLIVNEVRESVQKGFNLENMRDVNAPLAVTPAGQGTQTTQGAQTGEGAQAAQAGVDDAALLAEPMGPPKFSIDQVMAVYSVAIEKKLELRRIAKLEREKAKKEAAQAAAQGQAADQKPGQAPTAANVNPQAANQEQKETANLLSQYGSKISESFYRRLEKRYAQDLPQGLTVKTIAPKGALSIFLKLSVDFAKALPKIFVNVFSEFPMLFDNFKVTVNGYLSAIKKKSTEKQAALMEKFENVKNLEGGPSEIIAALPKLFQFPFDLIKLASEGPFSQLNVISAWSQMELVDFMERFPKGWNDPELQKKYVLYFIINLAKDTDVSAFNVKEFKPTEVDILIQYAKQLKYESAKGATSDDEKMQHPSNTKADVVFKKLAECNLTPAQKKEIDDFKQKLVNKEAIQEPGPQISYFKEEKAKKVTLRTLPNYFYHDYKKIKLIQKANQQSGGEEVEEESEPLFKIPAKTNRDWLRNFIFQYSLARKTAQKKGIEFNTLEFLMMRIKDLPPVIKRGFAKITERFRSVFALEDDEMDQLAAEGEKQPPKGVFPLPVKEDVPQEALKGKAPAVNIPMDDDSAFADFGAEEVAIDDTWGAEAAATEGATAAAGEAAVDDPWGAAGDDAGW